MRRSISLVLLSATVVFGAIACERQPQTGGSRAQLVQARAALRTRLVAREADNSPAEVPPAGAVRLVQYDAPVGKLSAYLTALPTDGKPHPAIIWITGGDCNSIGDVWSEQPADNDQSARAFREAGVVTMYPALRGGNGGPGRREGWLGEVDDVLAAAEFLAKQKGVDPQRIYIGGHSTGGTLALMVAESSDRFRAVFSLGPIHDVKYYGSDYLPFRVTRQDTKVRSPLYWLTAVQSPTFVFEGTVDGNLACLREMERVEHSPSIRFHPVDGVDHFSVVAPVTRLAAKKIAADTGPACTIQFSAAEIAGMR